jgi:hypothetical protein
MMNILFFDRKPAAEKPWTEKLWIYDLRTNKYFTVKGNRLKFAAMQASIPELAKRFFEKYDPALKDQIWRNQSDAFRSFWSTRILETSSPALRQEECDAMIRILDRNGKGNTRDSEAVAGGVMIPQGAWRRMFVEFRDNPKLAKLLNSILTADGTDSKSRLIDELYATNEGQKNRLTGKTGNMINIFLAAYDPFKNLSVVSLNDRRALIEFLKLPAPLDWDSASVGSKIVQSNAILYEGVQRSGIRGSARTVSCFCYFEPLRALWKPEHTLKRADKNVSVSVPSKAEEEEADASDDESFRESLQIQAALAEIGSRMGFKIWLPNADRARILAKWQPAEGVLLNELPLNYDDVTLRAIALIDVLWLRKHSIVRAFEVEHTTSVYSGLLRMADLIALQPNMNIKLHIVAPTARREKFLKEIKRPVFSALEGPALPEICTYLSYDDIRHLRDDKHLGHLSADVLEEYEESAVTD